MQDCVFVLPIFKISRSTLRIGANLRATVSWLHLGSQRITKTTSGRMALNRNFPRTQDLVQFVQRQVKTLIDRKRRIQHANLAVPEHISMVKDYVAE